MNWLEAIGLLTVIFIAFALVVEFIKSVDKTKAEHARNAKEMDRILAENKANEALKTAKIAEEKEFDRKRLAQDSVDKKQREEINSAFWYENQTDFNILEKEYGKIGFMGSEEKRNLFKRLSELSPEKWGDIYLNIKKRDEANKDPRPKGRGIRNPKTQEGTPQGAGNLPAVIKEK